MVNHADFLATMHHASSAAEGGSNSRDEILPRLSEPASSRRCPESISVSAGQNNRRLQRIFSESCFHPGAIRQTLCGERACCKMRQIQQ